MKYRIDEPVSRLQNLSKGDSLIHTAHWGVGKGFAYPARLPESISWEGAVSGSSHPPTPQYPPDTCSWARDRVATEAVAGELQLGRLGLWSEASLSPG